MITVKKSAVIAGLSELRTQAEAILKALKLHPVILEKRNRPIAVMVGYESYALHEEMLDLAEDYIMGCLAQKRDKGAKASDFIELEKW